jgi:hypothetical protein
MRCVPAYAFQPRRICAGQDGLRFEPDANHIADAVISDFFSFTAEPYQRLEAIALQAQAVFIRQGCRINGGMRRLLAADRGRFGGR